MDLNIDDDDDYVQVGESRIEGIGYGTFATLMFFIFILFVWLISDPIQSGIKWVWRFLTVLVCGIGFLLMVYAEREERYEGQGIIVKVGRRTNAKQRLYLLDKCYLRSVNISTLSVQEYDTSFNARTATFIILILFTLVSLVSFTKVHLQTNYQV